MTHQPLWVILCHLPEKGRKEAEEIGKMKEWDREERGTGMKVKKQEIKTFPLYQGSGNFEIWIGPADDDDVINEPISKKKCIYHLSRKLMTIGSPITPFK